jgi:hypothetical protein
VSTEWAITFSNSVYMIVLLVCMVLRLFTDRVCFSNFIWQTGKNYDC